MPWSRAKALGPPLLGIELFNAQFRIQREASEAAGHYIPMVVENVRGAQKWVGRARWHYGSFYLWGDVPALMPMTFRGTRLPAGNSSPILWRDREIARMSHAGTKDCEKIAAHIDSRKHAGSGWTEKGSLVSRNRLVSNQPQEGYKTAGMNWSNRDLRGQDFTRIAGKQSDGVKFSQSGDAWFDGKPRDEMLGDKGPAAYGSKSNARKAASAMIAKIPFPLAQHIARCFKPQ